MLLSYLDNPHTSHLLLELNQHIFLQITGSFTYAPQLSGQSAYFTTITGTFT